jgi:hypothetical protein
MRVRGWEHRREEGEAGVVAVSIARFMVEAGEEGEVEGRRDVVQQRLLSSLAIV